MAHDAERLTVRLSRLVKNEDERVRVAQVVRVLDDCYDLSEKIENEAGTGEIIEQLFGRLVRAYGHLSSVQGKRILEIACGSNTSKAPSIIHIRTPFRVKKIRNQNTGGYTAQFEPWFCRILLALGAEPVGVDIGDLEGETFEHYRVDLGREGALDFLPSHSFDAVQDSRLFGSPEFTAQFRDRADRLKVAEEIRNQERRLLKEGGTVIHSDAEGLLGNK
jgi:hypothetical protein